MGNLSNAFLKSDETKVISTVCRLGGVLILKNSVASSVLKIRISSLKGVPLTSCSE